MFDSLKTPIFVHKHHTMKKHALSIASFIGVIAVLLLVIFRKDPTPVYSVSPVKTIENRIEGAEKEIYHYETKVGDEKKIIAAISGQINELRAELEAVKLKRDTFQIIQIQDTLIRSLTVENNHLRTVIDTQDSIIVAQRYIINSKDTLIAIGKHDIKRIKRQRNISLAANGILTGIVIFK